MFIYYHCPLLIIIKNMFGIHKLGNNSFNFPFTKDAFTLYKNATRQYKDNAVLDYVRQFIPNEIKMRMQRETRNYANSSSSHNKTKNDSLMLLLHWFKNDFMEWMNNNQICDSCKTPMDFQQTNGKSWKLRAVEHYICPICKSSMVFPRYGEIKEIADSRIGRCSEWSMLFGAVLNSLSIETVLVHDFLNHCWNESLIDGKWTHIDSTLEYPISHGHFDYYEKNWGKKYIYVLAFSDSNVEDVTMRYTQNSHSVQQARSKHKIDNVIDTFKEYYLSI